MHNPNIDLSQLQYDDVIHIPNYGNLHIVNVEPSNIGDSPYYKGLDWRIRTNPPLGTDLFTIDGRKDLDEPQFITQVYRGSKIIQ